MVNIPTSSNLYAFFSAYYFRCVQCMYYNLLQLHNAETWMHCQIIKVSVCIFNEIYYLVKNVFNSQTFVVRSILKYHLNWIKLQRKVWHIFLSNFIFRLPSIAGTWPLPPCHHYSCQGGIAEPKLCIPLEFAPPGREE